MARQRSLFDKYETGGLGTASISNTSGDHGGASYGRYQFANNVGSLQEYVNSLEASMPSAYNRLKPLLGTASQGSKGAFGKAWMGLANNDQFQQAEDAYAQKMYVDRGLSALGNSEVRNKVENSPVLRQVYMSTAVQHGGGGANRIFGRLNGNMSEEQMINAVYDDRGQIGKNGELSWFKSSSPEVQRSVANRFKNERKDALSMLGEYRRGLAMVQPQMQQVEQQYPYAGDQANPNPGVFKSIWNNTVDTTQEILNNPRKIAEHLPGADVSHALQRMVVDGAVSMADLAKAGVDVTSAIPMFRAGSVAARGLTNLGRSVLGSGPFRQGLANFGKWAGISTVSDIPQDAAIDALIGRRY